MEIQTFAFLALGALAAGFVNGFAGFGTALVASGFWFLVLPPDIVPPLIIISAVAGQIVGLLKLSGSMQWRKSSWLVSGGVFGVPVGAALLSVLSPVAIKGAIGFFLLVYSLVQLKGLPSHRAGPYNDGFADRLVGFVGGVFGGFAGLSGPFPLIWLQLRGLPPREQRARYQPFNLLVLGFAAVTMVAIGKLDRHLLSYAMLSIPLSLLGAALGVRAFNAIDEEKFRKTVLVLLAVSGGVIVTQTLSG